jgi:DnaJ-domain-containing protein 1
LALDDVTQRGELLLRLLPHVSTVKSSARAGLAATLLTGGLGLEDVIIGPVAAVLMSAYRKRQKNAAMQQLQQTVIVARVRGIELLMEASGPSDEIASNVLQRFAALYLPGEPLPDTSEALEKWIESRLEWVESEVPALNEMMVDYCVAFGWRCIAQGLEGLGYRFAMRQSGTDGEAPAPSSSTMTPAEAATLLGVRVDASAAELKAAYRREAAKYHPDRLGDVAEDIRALAEARMKLINEANEVLSSIVRQ